MSNRDLIAEARRLQAATDLSNTSPSFVGAILDGREWREVPA